MKNQNIVAPHKSTNRVLNLPIIAFILGCLPLLMLIVSIVTYFLMGLNDVFLILFFLSYLSLFPFSIIGLPLGVVSLFQRKKCKGIKPQVFAIVSILGHFVSYLIFFPMGYFDYIMTYK